MRTEEKLIEENMDIPIMCTRKWYKMWSLEMEDLKSEGAVALVRAARSFDPSKGMSFRSWAYLKVKGHVTDVVRQHVRREKRTVTGEFAKYSSLQTEDEQGELIYQLADPNADVLDLVIAREQLEALKHIPKREAEIILRMARGESATEIAEMWGCSDAQIFKLLRQGRGRLRHANSA